MKNRDMPATPSQVSFNRERTERIPYQFGNDDFVEPGLTKREYAAIKIMAGYARERGVSDLTKARWAVEAANALFDELEKGQ